MLRGVVHLGLMALLRHLHRGQAADVNLNHHQRASSFQWYTKS